MSVYHSKLNLMETEKALKDIKTIFERELSSALNLTRISAPLFVTRESGLNDNLNGVERPVGFDIPCAHANAQVVHSLAKWKRLALHRYGFRPGKGLYTDMNAIRRDETLDKCKYRVDSEQYSTHCAGTADADALQKAGQAKYRPDDCAADRSECDCSHSDRNHIEGDGERSDIQISERGISHEKKNCGHQTEKYELRSVEFFVHDKILLVIIPIQSPYAFVSPFVQVSSIRYDPQAV